MTTSGPETGDLAPYALVPVGFEATYVSESELSEVDQSDSDLEFVTDEDGNVAMCYSLWGFAHATEDKWDDEIRAINRMQTALGPLPDDTRRIRAHIGSFVGCDNGVPVTIDELLNAIGTGELPSPAFHNGCWLCGGERTTQPHQAEAMRAIEDVLQSYLDGADQADLVTRYPYAAAFVTRTYDWLGSRQALSEAQQLMLARMLVPFAYFAKRNDNVHELWKALQDEGGPAKTLDASISDLVGLPPIVANTRKEYRTHLESIEDDEKRRIYVVCCHVADCISELSDCHHSMLRRIERWIHGIGTLAWDIPTRPPHAESTRLGRLFFGYALALDAWLRDVPMQFLLLDLGHKDLGFDPKNEILRTYATLGEEHTPVKRWLAACLWHQFVLNPPASLYHWGWRHKELLARAGAQSVSIRTWMDGQLSEAR